jgi:hypothetical protein
MQRIPQRTHDPEKENATQKVAFSKIGAPGQSAKGFRSK